jgi:uncharacterized protein (TIGR00725 family)
MTRRRPIIAVVGGNRGLPETLAAAEAVGRAIVDRGARLANGGLGGVMEASARGARSSSVYREGDTIGILPGPDARAANGYIDVAVPTALQFGRNAVLTGMADAVIAIGGGAGTLSEIALAWQQNKRVILLAVDEGWSEILGARALDGRRADTLIVASDPAEAVEVALGRTGGVDSHVPEFA